MGTRNLENLITKPEYTPPPDDATPCRVKVRGFSDEIFESVEQICDCFQITPAQFADAIEVGERGLCFLTPIGRYIFVKCHYDRARNLLGANQHNDEV